MGAAVLTVELTSLPDKIEAPGRYPHAFLLILYRGHPVGETWIPLGNTTPVGGELRRTLEEAGGEPLRRHVLLEKLGLENFSAENRLPSADIAVCTHERPDDLNRCLSALHPIASNGTRILVVDSGPVSEKTRRVTERFVGVRYIREPLPGLNRARNRALREAHGEIVAFTDDDAIPEPGWLPALLRNFNDRLVLCVTGLTLALEMETEAQELHERLSTFGRGYERRVFERINRSPCAAGIVGAGVNMAFRRNVTGLVGPFDETLDAGTPTRSGGDYEIFSRILGAGYRIVYEPDAFSRHRHRHSRVELVETFYGYGTGVYAAWTRSLLIERECSVPRQAAVWFFKRQFPSLIRSLLRRPGSRPLDLVAAELRGCANGPVAWFRSRAQNRKRENEVRI